MCGRPWQTRILATCSMCPLVLVAAEVVEGVVNIFVTENNPKRGGGSEGGEEEKEEEKEA